MKTLNEGKPATGHLLISMYPDHIYGNRFLNGEVIETGENRPSEIHRNSEHLLFAHVSGCGPRNRGRPQYSITNYHAVWLNVITFIRWPCRFGEEKNSLRMRFPGTKNARPFHNAVRISFWYKHSCL